MSYSNNVDKFHPLHLTFPHQKMATSSWIPTKVLTFALFVVLMCFLEYLFLEFIFMINEIFFNKKNDKCNIVPFFTIYGLLIHMPIKENGDNYFLIGAKCQTLSKWNFTYLLMTLAKRIFIGQYNKKLGVIYVITLNK